MQIWLDDVRAEKIPGFLPNKNISIKIEDWFSKNRRAGESIWLPSTVQYTNGNEVKVMIGEEVDICWCCMLYGKDMQVEPFVTQALILGYQLQTMLEPELMKKGFSFRNVMFITEEALNEGSFKAIAHFWSMQIVSLPEVHEKLKESISWHLKAGELDSRHVFLKAFAWQQKSKVAVISDLDMLITCGEKLGASLAKFADPTDEWGKLLEKGRVAVMDRKLSNLGQEEKPRMDYPMESGKYRRGLSYCMAIVKPDEKEAQRYLDELMLEPPKSALGILSDQNFLNEFLREKYVLLPMNIVLFMSWITHNDTIEKFAGQLVEMSLDWHQNKKRFADGLRAPWDMFHNVHPLFTYEFAKDFVLQFGAVHCSAAFSLKEDRTKEEHVQILMRKTKNNLINLKGRASKLQPTNLTKKTLVETLQWHSFSFLRDYRQRQIFEIHEKVVKAMGPADSKINPGIASMQFLVSKEYQKEIDVRHKKELELAREEMAKKKEVTKEEEEDAENRVQIGSRTRSRPWSGHVAMMGSTGSHNAIMRTMTTKSSGSGKGKDKTPPWRT